MGLINVSLFCSSRRLGIPGCLRGRERKNGGCIKSVEGYREKGGFFSFRIDSRRCFEGEGGVMNSKDNRKRKEEGSDHVGERDEIFRDAVLGVRYEI